MSNNKVIRSVEFKNSNIELIDYILKYYKEDNTIPIENARNHIHESIQDESYRLLSYDKVDEIIENMKKKKYYEIDDESIRLKRVPFVYKDHVFNKKLNDNISILHLGELGLLVGGFILYCIISANNPDPIKVDCKNDQITIDDKTYDFNDLYIVSIKSGLGAQDYVCYKKMIDEDDYKFIEIRYLSVVYSSEKNPDEDLIRVINSTNKYFESKIKNHFIHP